MTVQPASGAAGSEAVAQVALARIDPNPLQPRRAFPAEQIAELAGSLESQGVIQPLILRPHPLLPERYQLVAGERRLRAARLLGWTHVPALVRTVPDDFLLETALVENLQREQLTPMEEATAYRTLLDRYGYTQETLAERVGKDRSTIANLVRLLALSPPLRQDLDAGRLSVGHARALLAVPDPERQVALRNVVLTRGLSVRETESLIARERGRDTPGAGQAPPPPRPGPNREELSLQAARQILERRLATRVAIRREGQAGGRIEIEFYDLEDFNRLYALLSGRS
jgi:ParB family chromosome partitioning protein